MGQRDHRQPDDSAPYGWGWPDVRALDDAGHRSGRRPRPRRRSGPVRCPSERHADGEPHPAIAARAHHRGSDRYRPRPLPPLWVPPSPQETGRAGGTASDASARPGGPASGRSRDGHTGTRAGQESMSALPHARERQRRDVLLLRIQVPRRREAATVRILSQCLFEGRIPMRKDEEFSEWYNEVIERSELSDKRYPIKGMNVWRPYGWSIMKLIDQAIRDEFDSTGHGEVNFPVLIPESEFKKEAEHVKGFEGDVFWVTRGGFNELDVKLVLRPTSETAMYPMFKLWIRSHADLPLKVYQIVPVFRYETKMTRSFMRVREIHFFEAHTAHATFEDAEQQIHENLQMNERVMRMLALPYIVSRRPDWDKFPGAQYSLGTDTLLPSGRAAQVATFHQYRDNFAKVYDVTYETETGEHKYVHQTTDGMSERLLGALISIHGDEKGLVLPPAAAPVQAVVVPILEKGRQEEMLLEAQRLFLELRERMRVKLDDRDIRPGEKYYYWEARGVPLRVELGPRDLANQAVTVVRRDTGEKKELPRELLPERLRTVLELMQLAMWNRAEKVLQDNTFTITKLEDARDGFNRMGWCGKESCGKAITERTGMSVLGTPFYPEPFEGKCIVCGEKTKQLVYAAKAY